MAMRILLLLLLVGLATVPVVSAAADDAYVIDKLLVGVHQDQNLNSAIIKVLPTGTKLEVLKREGELALVKDAQGASGWVDSAYLMEEAPAGVKVEQLSKQVDNLKTKLSTASSSGPGQVSSEERDKLAKENTELKRKLSGEKLKVAEMQTKQSALEAKVAARSTTPADTIISELEKTNLALTKDLEGAAQENLQITKKLEARTDQPLRPVVVESFSAPVLFGFAVVLIVAFGGGAYLMDFLNRRRHGGFRV
ncbi:MAG: TIGR04211 family SH3 domain-containing protein [Gammaproteobacteria bacterium]